MYLLLHLQLTSRYIRLSLFIYLNILVQSYQRKKFVICLSFKPASVNKCWYGEQKDKSLSCCHGLLADRFAHKLYKTFDFTLGFWAVQISFDF